MKTTYFFVIFIIVIGLFNSSVMAGSGDPLKGLNISCAPLGCGKYAQPGPNYEQRRKMATSRTGRNPQTGKEIKARASTRGSDVGHVVAAVQLCTLDPIVASICLLPVPEDPVMQRTANSRKVKLAEINMRARNLSSKDVSKCNSAGGRLGRHKRSGQVFCVVTQSGTRSGPPISVNPKEPLYR